MYLSVYNVHAYYISFCRRGKLMEIYQHNLITKQNYVLLSVYIIFSAFFQIKKWRRECTNHKICSVLHKRAHTLKDLFIQEGIEVGKYIASEKKKFLRFYWQKEKYFRLREMNEKKEKAHIEIFFSFVYF